MSPLAAAKNEESQVAIEGLKVIMRTMMLYKTKIEDLEGLKRDTAKMAHLIQGARSAKSKCTVGER